MRPEITSIPLGHLQMRRSFSVLLVSILLLDVRECLFFGRHPTYSFQKPRRWGELSLESAECCPFLEYPSNASSPKQRLPHFIGLGVQKSGSTTLAWYLSCHPNIAMSRSKETHFMDNDYTNRTVKAYEQQWTGKRANADFRFEFTPNYIWIPFAACRTRKLFSEMKFVVVLRDPADRAYSEYNMVRRQCLGSNKYCIWRTLDYFDVIQQGVQDLRDRNCTFHKGDGTKSWNDCFGCIGYKESERPSCYFRPYYFRLPHRRKKCMGFGEEIVSRGLYAAQLAWWFNFYTPDHFTIILSHDFYKDPVFHLNRVMDLVGIDERFELGMLPKRGHGVGMKGNYSYPDLHKEDARVFLTEFYSGPNQELYRLLDEVKSGPYTPFQAPEFSTFHKNGTQRNSIYKDRSTFARSGTINTSFVADIPVTGLVLYSFSMTVIIVVITWYLVSNRHTRIPSK